MSKKRNAHLVLIALTFWLVLASAGCKKKTPVAPPVSPPPAAPTPAPTVSISADPSTIERGQSSNLSWSSTSAANVAIDQGIGDVATSGSRMVSPGSSTTYTITARGAGGTITASTRITVTTPPPPPAPPKPPAGPTVEELFSQRVRDIYFNYDKSDIRDDAKPNLTDAAEFLKQNVGARITIEGHCDERGSEEYNLGLGDRRANATKNYLQALGIAADRMTTISYGKERPQCPEANEECYQRNRRAHFVLRTQ